MIRLKKICKKSKEARKRINQNSNYERNSILPVWILLMRDVTRWFDRQPKKKLFHQKSNLTQERRQSIYTIQFNSFMIDTRWRTAYAPMAARYPVNYLYDPDSSIGITSDLFKFIDRGKSLLKLWVTTFLPDWQPPLILVRFISNFFCI